MVSAVSDGVTATFSSPDGAAFGVLPAFCPSDGAHPCRIFNGGPGHALLDADAALHTLDIGFSSVFNSVSMFFALNNPASAASKFTLTAFLGGVGGTLVGSTSTTGLVPPGFLLPEGTISFSGAFFDTLRLTSTARDFAIDNVAVDTVPITLASEPATLVLLGTGLASGSAPSSQPRERGVGARDRAQQTRCARSKTTRTHLDLEDLEFGVGEGIRTPNIRSHSPALCP